MANEGEWNEEEEEEEEEGPIFPLFGPLTKLILGAEHRKIEALHTGEGCLPCFG